MAEKKIAILTDNGCDIPLELAAQAGIRMLSFPIIADGVSYLQGENFQTSEEFYDIMDHATDHPKHAQITALRYYEEYERYFTAGIEELIVVTITSTSSATHQNALAASQAFYEANAQARATMRIHVLDARCYSIAYGIPTIEAGRMVREGKSIEPILAYLEDWFSSMEIYVSAYSLEYARRSGRIGSASAVLGEAMGIKPIISIIEGNVKTCRKVRGNAAVAQALFESTVGRMRPGSPYGILSGTYPEVQDILREKMVATYGYEPVGMFKVGPAVALNIGPQMLGIGFLSRFPRKL